MGAVKENAEQVIHGFCSATTDLLAMKDTASEELIAEAEELRSLAKLGGAECGKCKRSACLSCTHQHKVSRRLRSKRLSRFEDEMKHVLRVAKQEHDDEVKGAAVGLKTAIRSIRRHALGVA